MGGVTSPTTADRLEVVHRGGEDNVHGIVRRAMEVGVGHVEVTRGDLVMAEEDSLRGKGKGRGEKQSST